MFQYRPVKLSDVLTSRSGAALAMYYTLFTAGLCKYSFMTVIIAIN